MKASYMTALSKEVCHLTLLWYMKGRKLGTCLLLRRCLGFDIGKSINYMFDQQLLGLLNKIC